MNTENIAPVKSSERYVILDALRGFAILGICMANYPEFSLYTFQSSETIKAMPTSGIDHVLRYLLYIFVDGKFYTLFSLLFSALAFPLSSLMLHGKGQTVFRYFIDGWPC